VTGNAADVAGNTNSATVSGINIDKTPPSTTAAGVPSGWVNHNVTVTFTAQDQTGLSGVDHTEYSLDGAAWASGSSVAIGEGAHTLLYRGIDNAGNLEDSSTATVQVDLHGPTLTLTGPTSVSTTTASLSGTAVDAGSLLESLVIGGNTVTPDTDGTYSAVVTLACGGNLITATATDRVGNTTTVTHSVDRVCQVPVVWTTDGFFAPVTMSTDSKSYVNTVKGGSTVPLKFRVYKDGAEQKDLATVTGLKVATVKCDTGAVTDTVEQTVAGGTSLRYDGSQFVQNWKTPTALGCYQAIVLLGDGPSISADFRILK
jgi:hypothetical protein